MQVRALLFSVFGKLSARCARNYSPGVLFANGNKESNSYLQRHLPRGLGFSLYHPGRLAPRFCRVESLTHRIVSIWDDSGTGHLNAGASAPLGQIWPFNPHMLHLFSVKYGLLILTSLSSSFLNCIKSSNEARFRDMLLASHGTFCLSQS